MNMYQPNLLTVSNDLFVSVLPCSVLPRVDAPPHDHWPATTGVSVLLEAVEAAVLILLHLSSISARPSLPT